MKVLITGSSGMLGSMLVEKFKDVYEVYSTNRSGINFSSIKKFLQFDLMNRSYTPLIDWADPDVIIHCAANTNLEFCENNIEDAMTINGHALGLLEKSNAKIIYISSDAVFGDNLVSNENDSPRPLNVYGRSKLLGEQQLQSNIHKHSIIRTTIVGKNKDRSKSSFLDWIYRSLILQKRITLYDNVIFTPISIWQLGEEIQYIIDNSISGLYHIGCCDPISKYDFGRKFSEKLQLNTHLIQKGKIDDRSVLKRSINQSLDSRKYESVTGSKMPGIDLVIDSTVNHYQEYRNA